MRLGPADRAVRDRRRRLEAAQPAAPNFSVIEIADPSRYTVEFRDGGQLSVKADCNACSGSYLLPGGDALQIGRMAGTQAFCGAGSHDAAFLARLTSTRAHGVEHEVLSLYSDGVLRLTR